MVRNNHFTENRKTLDKLLRSENDEGGGIPLSDILVNMRFWASVENVLIVVSDMVEGKSHIIAGGFARNLDIGEYRQENSIWESRILFLMSPEEQEDKYIAELRFFHYLRHLPKKKRRIIILCQNFGSVSQTVASTMCCIGCTIYLTMKVKI